MHAADLDIASAIPQANDINPQLESPFGNKLEYWLVQTIAPIQQLFHTGVDLTNYSDVGAENVQSLPVYQGDLLRGIDKAERLLHCYNLMNKAKGLKTADRIVHEVSNQALSFAQLQALLEGILDRTLCAPEKQAGVHRFALSSVIFPLLKKMNEELIICLLIQWLILNGVFPKAKAEEWKKHLNFKLNAILEEFK